MYRKYSGSFITIMKLLLVSDQTYYLHLYYYQITWRALTRYKNNIWCILIILRVVLSHGYFFHARLISPVHGSFLTWLPCLPKSHFSVSGSQWLVLRNWGYVLVFSCLLLGYFVSRRAALVHALIGSLVHHVFFKFILNVQHLIRIDY